MSTEAIAPFYLSRTFVYRADDTFSLTVTNFADPNGKVAVARIELAGHMAWNGDHPIAQGAQKVGFDKEENRPTNLQIPMERKL